MLGVTTKATQPDTPEAGDNFLDSFKAASIAAARNAVTDDEYDYTNKHNDDDMSGASDMNLQQRLICFYLLEITGMTILQI